MSELANLIAKKFIARSDVKAIQRPDGSWTPHFVESRNPDSGFIKWRRSDLEAHLAGGQSFGHYLLNTDNTCKLFAFDIDLDKLGLLPTMPMPGSSGDVSINDPEFERWRRSFEPAEPREAWKNRAHPARDWMKLQLKLMAHGLLRAIHEELNIHGAVAYSGGKGVHVYGFLDAKVPASDAKDGAEIALEVAGTKFLNGTFAPTRGQNFFKSEDLNPQSSHHLLTIEVFPKQTSLDGKSLGNLMRLPLGKNLKNPKDPTFFVDMTSPLGQMVPLDPTFALTENPWRRPGE